MDNLVERYYDPSTDVTYDWDEEFQCYVGYIESKVNQADPFYYMYLDDDSDDVMRTPHFASDMSSTNDVLDLLGPKQKILSKATEVNSRVKFASKSDGSDDDDDSDIYGIGKASASKSAPSKAKNPGGSRPSMDDIRQELRAEVLQAAKEGDTSAAGRRSLTRRLTRKLTTIGGAMTMEEQLNLIADVKKEAGDLVIDDQSINEATAKENAAANARQIAMEHLTAKAAPAKKSPASVITPKPKSAPPKTTALTKKSTDSKESAAKQTAGRDSASAAIVKKPPIKSATIPKAGPSGKTLVKRLVGKTPAIATAQPAPS